AAGAATGADRRVAVGRNVARIAVVRPTDAEAGGRHLAAVGGKADAAAGTVGRVGADAAGVRPRDADTRRDLRVGRVAPGRGKIDADASTLVAARAGREIEAERRLVIDRLADDLRPEDHVVAEHARAGI